MFSIQVTSGDVKFVVVFSGEFVQFCRGNFVGWILCRSEDYGLFFVSIEVVVDRARFSTGLERWVAISTPFLCVFPGSRIRFLRVMMYPGMLR